jgi:hypothetical protein
MQSGDEDSMEISEEWIGDSAGSPFPITTPERRSRGAVHRMKKKGIHPDHPKPSGGGDRLEAYNPPHSPLFDPDQEIEEYMLCRDAI